MKIDKIELRKIFLPYISPFKTSGGTEKGNSGIIVKIFSEELTGWGEVPVSLTPWYVEETTSTAWSIINEKLSPLLLNNNIDFPGDVDKLFSNVNENNFAKAGLEFAIWDLYGKKENISLSEMLGGVKTKIPVGVSIGIQNSIEDLIKKVEEYLKEGYKRVKIKIKPGWDIEPVKAIRKIFPDILLQVDANSAYTLADADHLKKLDEFSLLLIEQPLGQNDITEHSKLQKKINTPICLDESITTPNDAHKAIELNACRVINIKPGRVGGLTAAKNIHDICTNAGIPVWCGGMLETGIGRAINVSLASLPNFTLPGDISANSRYFKRDVVLNPFTLNEDGMLTVPNQPGHGAVVDEPFLDDVTLEKVMLKK